jgi:hypothetical protein
MGTDEKVRENRLRRMAERQGLRLVKSRRRDPRAIDYGTYMLVNAEINGVVAITTRLLVRGARLLDRRVGRLVLDGRARCPPPAGSG